MHLYGGGGVILEWGHFRATLGVGSKTAMKFERCTRAVDDGLRHRAILGVPTLHICFELKLCSTKMLVDFGQSNFHLLSSCQTQQSKCPMLYEPCKDHFPCMSQVSCVCFQSKILVD